MFLLLMILATFVVLYVSHFENNLSYKMVRRSNNALDILNKKLANGEISENEYFRIKSTLNS